MKYQSNRAAVNAAIENGARRGLAAGAIHYQGKVKSAMSASGSTRAMGNKPSAPGSPPGVQSGTLRRSVQIDASKNTGKTPSVRIGTNVVYARIHEFGGTISAKGGALAVPIHPDAKRASAAGRSARDFDLFMLKRPGKAPLLIRDQGGQWDVMYVLPKSVVIPARPVWRPVFKRELEKIKSLIAKGIQFQLSKIGTAPGGVA